MLNIDWDNLENDRLLHDRGTRGRWIEMTSIRLGISKATLYRGLASSRGSVVVNRSGRESRISEELVRAVCYFKELDATNKLKGKRTGRELSTMEAIKMVIDFYPNLAAEARSVAVSTMNTALVRFGYRIPDPKVRVEATYAGQEYQIDFSRSKYFQVSPHQDDDILNWNLVTSGKELHYKDGRKYRERLWIAQLKDSHSRLQVMRAFSATSESAVLGIYFLNYALTMLPEAHMMRYLPERIKADNGAFAKSKMTRRLMKTLGVGIKTSEPGNSDSNGKVESGFAGLWQQFESPLATRLTHVQGAKAIISLADYNQALLAHTIALHDAPHPTMTGQTRGAVYQQSILRHPLKEVDIDVASVATGMWERKVDKTCIIHINGSRFEAPQFAVDKWVRVYRNLEGDFAGELIDGYAKPFILPPFTAKDLDSFEHRQASTFAQSVRTDVQAHLAAKKQAKSLRPRANIIRPKTPVDIARESQEQLLTIYESRVLIGRAMRDADLDIRVNDVWDMIKPQLLENTPRIKVETLAKTIVNSLKKVG